MRTPVLALAQIRVVGGDSRGNLLRAARSATKAAAGGADIIVFPETMDLGWTHHSAAELAEPIPDGATFDYLADIAEDNAIYVCAGLTERDGENIFNTAVFINRQGKLLLKHRKLNELEFAKEIYTPGIEPPQVCSTEYGKIGVMICADAFVENHTISRTLGESGADFILSPCAWAVPPEHDNAAELYGQLWIDSYTPVAREFSLWIAAVSSVGKLRSGEWAGHHCIGSSMLIAPDGSITKRLPFGRDAESLELFEIPLP